MDEIKLSELRKMKAGDIKAGTSKIVKAEGEEIGLFIADPLPWIKGEIVTLVDMNESDRGKKRRE